MRKFKILSLVLAVVLLLSVVPVFMATAEGTVVNNAEALVEAIKNGDSEITVQGFMNVYQTLNITKDLTLNLDINPNEPWFGAGIVISKSGAPESPVVNEGFKIAAGATLTINVHERLDQIEFSGADGALFLLEANEQAAAKLIINNGRLAAKDSTHSVSANCSMFKSNATAQDVKPSVTINNGVYINGNFSSGIMDIKVFEGEFGIDPTAYLADNSHARYIEMDSRYEVIKLATEFSAEFKKHMDGEGNFIIKRYHPSVDGDYDKMFREFDSMFEEYTDDGYVYYSFQDYDKENDTALVSRLFWANEGAGYPDEENHIIKLKFVYDTAVKQEVDKVVKKVNDANPNPQEMNWFAVTDLELINYWLADSKGNANGAAFLMFSSEFRKVFDYKNYGFYLSSRLGNDAIFETAEGGEGLFTYNGVVYGSTSIGAEAKNVLYVPTETENTINAKLSAVQKKIDDFLGKDKVNVKATTLNEALMYHFWEDCCEKGLLDEYPNATFEGYLNKEYPAWAPAMPDPEDPEYDQQLSEMIEYYTGFTNVTLESPCFVAKIGNKRYYFTVECDSTKIVNATKYQSNDAVTNVSVSTDDTNIPLDTVLNTEKLTSGETYDKIIKTLEVKENATYDITLYSETAGEYITKLANGKFEVKLPVSKELESKQLAVYYVDTNNKTTVYDVTVSNGFATFQTDHFSIYTLAEKKSSGTVVVEDGGVRLEYEEGVFPSGTVIEIEKQTEGEIFKRAETSLKGVAKKMEVFEITATSNNVAVQPDGTVTARLSIPQGFDYDRIGAFYVDANGKYEKIPHELDKENRFAILQLKHFSTYVLAEVEPTFNDKTEEKSPATGNNANIILLAALAFVSGATVIYSTRKIKA